MLIDGAQYLICGAELGNGCLADIKWI